MKIIKIYYIKILVYFSKLDLMKVKTFQIHEWFYIILSFYIKYSCLKNYIHKCSVFKHQNLTVLSQVQLFLNEKLSWYIVRLEIVCHFRTNYFQC